MMLANTNSPPPPALRANPYTVDEIDAHPDRARIWATIIAMRFAHQEVVEKLNTYISTLEARS